MSLTQEERREIERLEYEAAAAAAMADKPPPPELDSLGHKLLAEFHQALLERRDTEQRWLRDLRQYKGRYEPEEEASIGAGRSKTFVRKTRVKIKTLNSRVADLLFPAGSDKNWHIEPTPKPTLSEEQKKAVVKQLQEGRRMMLEQASQAAQTQGQQLPPEAVQELNAPITQEEIEAAAEVVAKDAARGMSKTIEDQLAESRYKAACLRAIHSCHLYGTGVMKGPLVERKVRTRFVFEENAWRAEQETFLAPFIEFVPVWRFYPDMQASCLQGCRFVYERHQMSAADMADLAARNSFRGDRIKQHVEANPEGSVIQASIDNELKSIGDRDVTQSKTGGAYDVLERWGWLSGEQLSQAGAMVPEARKHESFFSNVWMLPNGQVIKAVLQPIDGVTWPYHIYSFDQDETSIFAEGIASIMRDDQAALNAASRMILDNAAITAGSMLEVVPGLLSSHEKLDEAHPWKVWIRNNTNPGQPAVRPINLGGALGDLQAISRMFDINADEVTAIPRYMTGENVSTGAAGTMGGMSMLMGAANIVIKDLINAWDEGVTQPFLTALYRWNMKFSKDASIKGDFDVRATGAASLVAKEVRAQALNNFAQLTANPMDAPYIKRDELNRQRAEALEMANIVRSQEEVEAEMNSPAAQQAQQMQEAMAQLELQERQIKLVLAQAQAEKLAAEASRVKAEEALTRIKGLDLQVEAIYAALQAGGVAVQNPGAAPAGDEILRSVGWQDVTPKPRIADLMGEEVQGGQVPPMQSAQPAEPELPDTAAIDGAVQPETGLRGVRAGIETARIEGAQ